MKFCNFWKTHLAKCDLIIDWGRCKARLGIFVMVKLDQGSQTQSDSRAAWESNCGIAGHIEKMKKNIEAKITVCEKIGQIA